MSSMDATYHAAQDIIYAPNNPALTSPLVKLGNRHKEELNTLAKIFRKANPLEVPLRVPVMEVVQKKLQELNQEGTQINRAPQSKTFTNA